MKLVLVVLAALALCCAVSGCRTESFTDPQKGEAIL